MAQIAIVRPLFVAVHMPQFENVLMQEGTHVELTDDMITVGAHQGEDRRSHQGPLWGGLESAGS